MNGQEIYEGNGWSGAGRVLAVWVALGVAGTAVLRTQITATIEPWFLVALGLGGAGLLAPVYGATIYFIVRQRQEKRTARGAFLTAIILFILGLGFAGAVMVMMQALSHLR